MQPISVFLYGFSITRFYNVIPFLNVCPLLWGGVEWGGAGGLEWEWVGFPSHRIPWVPEGSHPTQTTVELIGNSCPLLSIGLYTLTTTLEFAFCIKLLR